MGQKAATNCTNSNTRNAAFVESVAARYLRDAKRLSRLLGKIDLDAHLFDLILLRFQPVDVVFFIL